jgi:stress-induced morphogen
MSSAVRAVVGAMEEKISRKLVEALKPVHMVITNESYKHNVPKGSESHFHVLVVSNEFDKLPLIKRHRSVNTILGDELKSGIHALSILAKTPQEWEVLSANQETPATTGTPNCMGGSKA